MSAEPLVSVVDLHVSFPGPVHAVRGISFDIAPGERVALVGESGSGKSVTARTLVGLAGPTASLRVQRLVVAGRDTRDFTERHWRRLRGRGARLVLQDALVSLDPLRTVGREIGEVLRTHDIGERRDRGARVTELLDAVHVPEPALRAKQYPHQLSGGLRQRALIASAIAADPPLLIADEPTTALDVTVQAQILRLLAERQGALLLVSHDLSVVSRLADRVLVMHDGRIVEQGPTARVLTAPEHRYTRTLLAAVPTAASRGKRLSTVERLPMPPRVVDTADVVLRADGVHKRFDTRHAVNDVSFTLARGETLGVVGESGSGKTTLARIALALAEPDAGTVRLGEVHWSGVRERLRRPHRRRIQSVAQDPLSSFDPRYPVEKIVGEPLPDADRRGRVVELLERVGLGATFLRRRPRDLSGGQRQRVAIARALGPRPDVLVCDEPVSALDVSIQAQILDLLAEIQAVDGTALLFISHDLGVVHHLADRVLVMKDGRVVERGPAERVLTDPTHDYTRELVAAVAR